MSKKFFPPEFLSQAHTMMVAWHQIDSKLVLGSLTHASMGAQIERARDLDAEIARLETILVDRRNQRGQAYSDVWDSMKRVRASVKGLYGDDSSQYEMVGGTRMSERKPPTRKAAA